MAKENGKNEVAVKEAKSPVAAFESDMERLAARLWQRFGHGLRHPRSWTIQFSNVAPNIDVFEREGQLVVHADVPGIKREDINVEVDGDMLIIRGSRAEAKKVEKKNYFLSERSSGEFYRSFPLPEGVEAKDIKATLNDGVLEVAMPNPKPQTSKKTAIEVK
ncbi:MAG: Hsp20/alpha crystallin family protein [Chloroflexi bacterium]|nr:Hsp20/alpha crystallin family protein [Chloroflexota bacterium]